MRLRYELQDAGWADVTVECAGQEVVMTASYLHDSLRGLALAARAVACGAPEARVIFMDEPGEHELVMCRQPDGVVALEIVWYDGWKSWNLGSASGQTKLSGPTSVAHVRGQVLSEMRRLWEENGEAGYLVKWVEHPFPLAEMKALEEAG